MELSQHVIDHLINLIKLPIYTSLLLILLQFIRDTTLTMLQNLVPLSRLLSLPVPHLSVRYLNANRCVVTKVKRAKFARLHPTMAVLPDGSTITSKTKDWPDRYF